MRKKLALIVIFLFCGILFAGESAIDYFTAKSDGKVITVEWKTSNEQSVSSYDIERATTANNPIFRKVKSIDAKGAGSYYQYIDEEAFMRDGSGGEQTLGKNVYFYRLRINKSDDSYYYSETIDVTHYISSIRRTWGMIKEMFR